MGRSSLFVESSQTHDTNAAPAYLACPPSRDDIGAVLTNARKNLGTSGAHEPRIAADITLLINRHLLEPFNLVSGKVGMGEYRLQADVAALKATHAAIREANAALVPATLERIFHTEATA